MHHAESRLFQSWSAVLFERQISIVHRYDTPHLTTNLLQTSSLVGFGLHNFNFSCVPKQSHVQHGAAWRNSFVLRYRTYAIVFVSPISFKSSWFFPRPCQVDKQQPQHAFPHGCSNRQWQRAAVVPCINNWCVAVRRPTCEP